jgi:hypothetical protein
LAVLLHEKVKHGPFIRLKKRKNHVKHSLRGFLCPLNLLSAQCRASETESDAEYYQYEHDDYVMLPSRIQQRIRRRTSGIAQERDNYGEREKDREYPEAEISERTPINVSHE